MVRTLFAALLLALVGCTTSYKDPTLPSDHPANPAAVQADPPTTSRTLDLSAADPVHPGGGGAGSHGGQGGGDAKPPAQQHGASDATGGSTPALPPSSSPVELEGLYTCAMHAQVIQDRPGKCPICGMTLKKLTAPSTGGKP